MLLLLAALSALLSVGNGEFFRDWFDLLQLAAALFVVTSWGLNAQLQLFSLLKVWMQICGGDSWAAI